MTSKEANAIPIKGYLDKLGFHPVKEKIHYGMYLSPFRRENVASFKVDYWLNLWYDFGSGEGGTMIDLFMKMNKCTFKETMSQLEASTIPPSSSFHGEAQSVRFNNALPITSNGLIKYIKERCIDIDTAILHCNEVHYSVNRRNYYAIGFKNNSGGYELRNPWFKGCISPKDMTTIGLNHEACTIFEGFLDYLSYLTLNRIRKPDTDVVVLNSIVYWEKSLTFLKNHKIIHAYLDNDQVGKTILEKIKLHCPQIVDESVLYKDYKDLNEFLVFLGQDTRQSINQSVIHPVSQS